jgi:NET1-associated nuclear protein 1 (U3 small nucleolar RNA-associated protein 17)
VTKRTIDDKELDFVFTIDSKNNSWFITVHILQTAKEPYQTEAHTLLKSSEPIMNLNIQGEADVLVASFGRRLMIGALNSSSIQPLKDMLYTWREFDCSEWISSLEARFHIHSVGLANTKGDGSSFLEAGSVDIAVGGIQGSIFIYRDILRDLVRKERKKQLAPPVAERLHWHRNGVGAVKWSADGMLSS